MHLLPLVERAACTFAIDGCTAANDTRSPGSLEGYLDRLPFGRRTRLAPNPPNRAIKTPPASGANPGTSTAPGKSTGLFGSVPWM
jgi:hypothetical protein